MIAVRSGVDFRRSARLHSPIEIVARNVVVPRAEALVEIAVESRGNGRRRGHGGGRLRWGRGRGVGGVQGPHRTLGCHGELDVVDADVTHVPAAVHRRDPYLYLIGLLHYLEILFLSTALIFFCKPDFYDNIYNC